MSVDDPAEETGGSNGGHTDGSGGPAAAEMDSGDAATGSLSPPLEDALRHIYALEQAGDGWVSNSDLASQLEVTQPTVTSTFDGLAARGLVDHENYRPVQLTPAGEVVALHVVRRHRLLETYLCAEFDYALEEIHAEADVLEHHVSDRLCRAMEQALGAPRVDPHGDPIPDASLEMRSASGDPLSETDAGADVVVTRLLAQTDETLGYLVAAGIEPDASLRVVECTPIGMTTVRVAGHEDDQSLPRSIAAQVLVTER